MKFGRDYFDWKFVELYQVWEISGLRQGAVGANAVRGCYVL
jgi:hypothetical protein